MPKLDFTSADRTLQPGDMAVIIYHPNITRLKAERNVGAIVTITERLWSPCQEWAWKFKDSSKQLYCIYGGAALWIPEIVLLKIPPPSLDSILEEHKNWCKALEKQLQSEGVL